MMRTLIAIPVHNEQKYVDSVLRNVRRHATSDILVIDDGSTDNTPTLLAKQPVDVIRHAQNRGYGCSIRDAFRWAQCYRYDWLITMDCDEQHEPESLPDFYQAIKDNDADIISGSRYMPTPPPPPGVEATSQSDMPPEPPVDRREVNATVTRWINERLGLSITDAFCGYKAYRVASLKNIHVDLEGYAMPLQVWVQAAAADLRVKEVPVRLIYNDPNRSFGGKLDDKDHRLEHYRQAFKRELKRFPEKFKQTCLCSKSSSGQEA